jgi:RimJ/RimL family protein N-acetyltransferase
MRPIESFDTPRMVTRRPGDEDFDDLCRLFEDPAVMATLGPIRSRDQTRRFLDDAIRHWERHGYGIWMLYLKDGGEFVGYAGLRNLNVAGNDEVELLYALRAEFWNQGLASEAAHAVTDIAFNKLGLASIVAFTVPNNLASRRVMEKVGMRYERDIIHAGLPHVLARISAQPRR